MATECARATCKSGRVPDDPASESGQALKDCLETLSQQEGCQRIYWGLEVENPDVFRLFVDWDSVGAHEKFMASEGYKPFCDRLGFILDFDTLWLCHAKFTPHPPITALSDTSSPVTEIVTAYFPASYSESDQKSFEEGLKQLVSTVEKHSDHYRGSAGGFVKEELEIPNSNGEKGKAYILLIGWDSVQDHLDFRETQAFKDNIHVLRKAKDLKTMNVFHAPHTLVTRGGGVGDDAGESAQEEILNPQQGGKQSVKTAADGSTTKNSGDANALKKERAGR